MHASYEAQLRYKAALIREALERVGKFTHLPAVSVRPSPSELGYRSRVRLHIDERGAVGYYQRGTRRLLEVAGCPIAKPELNHALECFVALAAEHRGAAAQFSEVELRLSPAERSPSAWLVPRSPRARDRAFEDALARRFHVVVADGPDGASQRWPLLAGVSLRVPTRAFVQVNWEMNELLVSAMIEGARQRGLRRFLDLYAGAGNFTVGLASAGLSGIGVESNAEAAAAARQTLTEHGLASARFLREDSLAHLRGMSASDDFDLMVLDPPRAGAADVMPELARLHPRAVAYCSCDPVTLARDLRTLTAARFELESLEGFDMFPGTHHVETLAWLRSMD
jgi:23S rRNA (uracil1939-C5)-methyltransferase